MGSRNYFLGSKYFNSDLNSFFAEISESLVLAESKNTDFVKIGGTKKNHGPNSRGTSRIR
jgi:hypothetical protein